MRLVCVVMVVWVKVASAQVADLGHRLPGGIGLDAGSQADQGLYIGDRVAWFASDTVKNRSGATVPIPGFDLDAYAEVLGVTGVVRIGSVYAGMGFAVPVARISVSADQPQASVDRFGLADTLLEPLRVGARLHRCDVVAAYSLYVPTGQIAQQGVGRPQWAHQISAGGTVFGDDHRGLRASALASYVINHRKLDIDIRRGDTFQIQGGAGTRILRIVDLGVAGYALWQVTDDTGSALPAPLRGTRERAFGLGPELDVALPPLASRLTARFEWDLDGRARPIGTILVVGITVVGAR